MDAKAAATLPASAAPSPAPTAANGNGGPGKPASELQARLCKRLPPVPDVYLGREDEANAILQELVAQQQQGPGKGAVCLVAGPGMGKSSLALDVGHEAFTRGLCPGKQQGPGKGTVCLVAGSGTGKSSLALNVGQKAFTRGLCPGKDQREGIFGDKGEDQRRGRGPMGGRGGAPFGGGAGG